MEFEWATSNLVFLYKHSFWEELDYSWFKFPETRVTLAYLGYLIFFSLVRTFFAPCLESFWFVKLVSFNLKKTNVFVSVNTLINSLHFLK